MTFSYLSVTTNMRLMTRLKCALKHSLSLCFFCGFRYAVPGDKGAQGRPIRPTNYSAFYGQYCPIRENTHIFTLPSA